MRVESSDPRPELLLDPDSPDARSRSLHLRPGSVLIVAVGGSLGTLARYGLELLAPAPSRGWPWGTFTANLLGAFVLGVLLEGLAQSGPDRGWRQRARLLVGTGFCGGLTTYSTFAVEADLLMRARTPVLAMAYLAVTLVAGLLVAGLGIAAATGLRRERRGSW